MFDSAKHRVEVNFLAPFSSRCGLCRRPDSGVIDMKATVLVALVVALLAPMAALAEAPTDRGAGGSSQRIAWCDNKFLSCYGTAAASCQARYPNDADGYIDCMSNSWDVCDESWGGSCISAAVKGGASIPIKPPLLKLR
jgi:hypothetical protein